MAWCLSGLTIVFSVADQSWSGEIITYCQIPYFFILFFFATWNKAGRHYPSVRAFHPERDIRVINTVCECGVNMAYCQILCKCSQRARFILSAVCLSALHVGVCVAQPHPRANRPAALHDRPRGEERDGDRYVTMLLRVHRVLAWCCYWLGASHPLPKGWRPEMYRTKQTTKKIEAESRVSADTHTSTHYWWVISDDVEGLTFVWVYAFKGNPA